MAGSDDCQPGRGLTADPFVVLVGDGQDRHVSTVQDALTELDVNTLRISLLDLDRTTLIASPHGVTIGDLVVPSRPIVFWRDGGRFRTPDGMRRDEVDLLTAEAAALLLGALELTLPRWVDHPHRMLTAANKLLQLRVARELGLRTPAWLVSNDCAAVTDFVAAAPTLVKAVSSGPGLNPYAERVDASDMTHVAVAPTMFQHIVEADADVRLVTVADQVFVWQRGRRSNEPNDWRAVDPAGEGFVATSTDAWHVQAAALAGALGLSITVQDWLIPTVGDPVFLEANTRGNWLFLPDAAQRVTPALSRLLVGRP